MADSPPITDSAHSHPDIMNDAAFNPPPPPARRDTLSSTAGSDRSETCRICRSEGTPEEPLFYPCKCAGSIKFVHQECLMEWLSHSHKKHCELCKTPFRFTKLYDANMPPTLPWGVFVRRACWHIVLMVVRGCRTALVGFVWLGLIPWLIRWIWRWLFWIADAAWAREAFMKMMLRSSQAVTDPPTTKEWIAQAFHQSFPNMGFNVLERMSGSSNTACNTITTEFSSSFSWPQADPSILSSWTYLASLTPNNRLNRLILDVFEGQLITCVIITGFILVFLIREWVVQQQPLANLDNVQQQLREAADRVQADNERLRRQQELLEQARARLVELQNETENFVADAAGVGSPGTAASAEFMGWEALDSLIDKATGHLRKGGEAEHANFLSCAVTVTSQIRAAGTAGESLDDFSDKVYQKLAGYSDEERKEWEAVLISEIERSGSKKGKQKETANGPLEVDPEVKAVRPPPSTTLALPGFSESVKREYRKAQKEKQSEEVQADIDYPETSDVRARRPPMPDRDFSSRATQIQRLLAEAEEVFNSNGEGSSSRKREDAEVLNDSPTLVSAPSSESWQEVTPPNESTAVVTTSNLNWKNATIPITNAGPDAKINIKWRGPSRETSGFKIQEKMLEVDEKISKLKEELAKETQESQTSTTETSDPQEVDQAPNIAENNPFHPDGPEPEARDNDSFGNRFASVFREEVGIEDREDFDNHEVDVNAIDAPPAESQPQDLPRHQADQQAPSRWERLADWFWGDIETPNTQEPVPAPEEEMQEGDAENAQVAPFVSVQDGQPVVNAPEQANAEPQQPQNDPEVVAAAQQAGIDPEAIDDAEDLEGIFELIGLQGPLIGLFQTSAFCLLLVACTVFGAVVVPYLGGKFVLSVISSPVYFFLQLPLQVASFIVDFLIDTTLIIAGAIIIVAAFAVDFMFSAVQSWAPTVADTQLPERAIAYCTTTIANAADRLQAHFPAALFADAWALGWAFLRWSVHAHSSLRNIQDEVDVVLHSAGSAITWIVETVSSGSVMAVCKESLESVMDFSAISISMRAGVSWLQDAMEPLLGAFSGIMRGTLTFSTADTPMDPSLVYWDSTDRALAILTGYCALAALAAIYVAADTPITKSESGRKTEKLIRDTLRQAGGVLKVILIISIEMLVFPLYCGLLLDIAFLPLFKNADVASRWAFALRKPNLFCFVHWFVGTCYMFHFALFVGMCRKILRKGVLWFIRDPDDPTFHPVRDVLERNVATQLRKIAFSALVYGALVILCLGGVIWSIGHVFDEIFPIHWVSTEPILEFPLDMLLYNFVTPIVLRMLKPSDAVNTMYAWWLRRCARALRLSHFLFDDRRKDEEGHFVHQSWSSFLLRKRPHLVSLEPTEEDLLLEERDSDVSFTKDGMYVLTPCNDQYRPPKSDEAFLHLDENDAWIADKDGKKNEHFAKIYIPPLFRIRISLFMVCLWLFSAVAGLCSTLVPLVLGRWLLAMLMPKGLRVSDIYAYSLGAYIVGGALFAALKGRLATKYVQEKAANIDVKAWIEPMKSFGVKALKCTYVYGFLGVIMPAILALSLQFYVILPLHTYGASAATAASGNTTSSITANLTQTLASNSTQSNDRNLGSLAEHTFHVFQDYTLGLLYVRVFTRMIVAAPASRAAEAFRRITANGYFDPDVRLATRFFVLPATCVAAVVLTLPPILAKCAMAGLRAFAYSENLVGEVVRVKAYRYSYPAAAGVVVAVLGAAELGKATRRWRARIRDEAYLVGERLHNFGEKRPPPGSKSVVRKER